MVVESDLANLNQTVVEELNRIMKQVSAMFEEEEQQLESMLKRSESETESPCLMILREKLSVVVDDEEVKLLNFEALEEGLSAFDEAIRSRKTISLSNMEVTSTICTRNNLISENLVDQNNAERIKLSLVSYLTSFHFSHHQRDPISIPLNDCKIQNRRKENLKRFSTSLATLTFPLFLFSTIFTHPFKTPHESHSLLLTLFTLFNFMGFVFAATVMILVQARFSLSQIIVLIISSMALNICSSNFFIFMLISIPILALLCAVWCLHLHSSPS